MHKLQVNIKSKINNYWLSKAKKQELIDIGFKKDIMHL